MSLSVGTRLGPYEILSRIGAGGMGEVYRAKDIRLGRNVAIKTISTQFSEDRDRLDRFEREARTASALNHPNIVTIYDIGSIDTVPYIAMEFVDGKTLRQLLASESLPARTALQIAAQLAEGLSKAHDAGIVHRDLKPENIMITKEGHPKILDFGLAKLLVPTTDQISELPTTAKTKSGIILGTVGYMSPEQAGGGKVDFRSDQFSFGAILYEILSGKRAFQKNTTVETLSAIIREDPEPLRSDIPPPARWLVERCLQKNPSDRYASTHDLAMELQSIRNHFSEVTSGAEKQAAFPSPPAKRKLQQIWNLIAAALILALGAVSFFALTNKPKAATNAVGYHRLTYGRGTVFSARFAPDGQTVVYSAAFSGQPRDLYLTRTTGVDSRPLGIHDADVLSISPSGEMLLLLHREKNILAQAPLTGGSPRELKDNVLSADWTPDGTKIALSTGGFGKSHIEFPEGTVLYNSERLLDHVRLSRKGEFIAFRERMYGDNGIVKIIDIKGKTIAASKELLPDAIAWPAAGDEVWFTSAGEQPGSGELLYALSLSGSMRLITQFPSYSLLEEIFQDGRALINVTDSRLVLMVKLNGENAERDLSVVDASGLGDLSPDAKLVLIHESGQGSESPFGTIYLRKADGSPAIRLAAGGSWGKAFSPDGKWVLGQQIKPAKILLIPIGAGSIRSFMQPDLIDFEMIGFFPDGKKILATGTDKNRKTRLYVQEITGGPAKPLATEVDRLAEKAISPNGRFLMASNPEGTICIFPLEKGEPKPLAGIQASEQPFQWTSDGSSVLVFDQSKLPAIIYKLDVTTGKRELFKEIMPPDAAGVRGFNHIRFSTDEKSYAYSFRRDLSNLYLIDGLK